MGLAIAQDPISWYVHRYIFISIYIYIEIYILNYVFNVNTKCNKIKSISKRPNKQCIKVFVIMLMHDI